MHTGLTEPFLNARFRVEIEGLPSTGVVEVIFPEGRIVPRTGPKGTKGKVRVQYGPLTLRRGMTASGDWYRWWDTARRSATAAAKRVHVVLIDSQLRDLTRWTFSGVVPSAYAVSHLNALQSELLMETLELSVAGFTMASGAQQSEPPVRRKRSAALK
jgi:phage tail-like protein